MRDKNEFWKDDILSSLSSGSSHRSLGVGVGVVSAELEFAAIDVQSIGDEGQEGEEEQEEDQVAGEVDKMGPPARRPFDVHL